MCFGNQSPVCPQYPDLEVLAGQPSISSFSMFLVAPGQWWALEMMSLENLVLWFCSHILITFFGLLVRVSLVTERKSWPAEGREEKVGWGWVVGASLGGAVVTFLRAEASAGSGFLTSAGKKPSIEVVMGLQQVFIKLGQFTACSEPPGEVPAPVLGVFGAAAPCSALAEPCQLCRAVHFHK